MNGITFDTRQAVRRLEAAGIETRQAEAIVSEMRDAGAAGREERATKAGLEATKADVEVTIGTLRADLYRALWMQGGAIAALILAAKLL